VKKKAVKKVTKKPAKRRKKDVTEKAMQKQFEKPSALLIKDSRAHIFRQARGVRHGVTYSNATTVART